MDWPKMVNPTDKWKYENFFFLFDYIIFVIFLITFDVSLIAWLWLWNRAEISSSIAFPIIFRQSKTWFYNYSDPLSCFICIFCLESFLYLPTIRPSTVWDQEKPLDVHFGWYIMSIILLLSDLSK